ncbi:MAG: radical SAM protein [Candidatus Rokubacteria bacterium]|nr:radical SAM protein [Candidatus Rokubacteria bacterium]MBI3106494.1 radical SAM protein [Candidatus Rokubacteria bacterium]
MREPGAILLIACYELGHQPLSIAWPAAVLAERGYAPATLDVSVEPFDPEQAARARLVAISVPMHTALRVGVTVADRVRAVNPGCHICFFGLYASLNADYLLAHGVDSVIGGESEQPLAGLADALTGGEDPRVPGVATARGPSGPYIRRRPLPRPSRASLPALKQYARLERAGRREVVGYVEASRGCLHLCRHCPIPPVYGGRFFAVPRDTVLADIRQQVAAGATHITFGDPDFLNGPGQALAVARGLHAEFPTVTFDFTAKVEHLLRHRRLLPELAVLGGIFVVSAVESLSDTVLTHLAKGHTRADVTEALRAVRESGIAFRPTWVAFTPWAALEDYGDMLDFVERESLVDHVDPVQYSLRLLVPPGSLLLESPALRPFLDGLVQEDFSYRWTHPDPRMEALHTAIAAGVAEAAEREEDPAVTFDRVRARWAAAAGLSPGPSLAAGLPSDRARPPRMTEPWFC